MKNIYQNSIVEHSWNCTSVSCLIDNAKGHVSCFHFDTKDKTFIGDSLNSAAELWIKDGKAELVEVGRVG